MKHRSRLHEKTDQPILFGRGHEGVSASDRFGLQGTHPILPGEGAMTTGPSSTPRPPAPTITAPNIAPLTQQIYQPGAYEIAVGQQLYFDFTAWGGNIGFFNPTSLINRGEITIIAHNPPSNNGNGLLGIAGRPGSFHNTSTGVIRVFGDDMSTVGVGETLNFINDGLIQIVSIGRTAARPLANLFGSYLTDGTFRNTGTIGVWSSAVATGVNFSNGGNFFNSGTIQIVAPEVQCIVNFGRYGTFLNSGTLEAIDGNDDEVSVAVAYWSFGSEPSSPMVFVNTGTIIADYAILYDGGSATVVNSGDRVENSGLIRGNIDLATGDDVVINTGTIEGLIILDEGADRYQGANGHLENGAVLGGYGDDIIEGGASNEYLFGEEGADTISGGKGDDYIDGGRGADILDGGLGFDVLSYASSHMGVNVDMAAGRTVAPSNNDTFQNFEDIVGSDFADVLSGDSQANIIEGALGDDVLNGRDGADVLWGGRGADRLTGGAGADVFVLNIGDGADRITDFDVANDRLFVGGYQAASDIRQTAEGALISFSNGDSFLLEGVSASSLTAAHFQWSAAPLAGTTPIVDLWRTGEVTVAVERNNYVVAAGETIRFTDSAIGFYVGRYSPWDSSPSIDADLDNYGTIINHRSLSATGVWGNSGGGAEFRNHTGASLEVVGGVDAWGVYIGFPSLSVQNDGRMVVTGQTRAAGIDSWNSGGYHINTGTMEVRAVNGSAFGIRTVNDVQVSNSGTITVSAEGNGVASGIDFGRNNFNSDLVVVNSGTITVTDQTAALDSAAIVVGRTASGPFSMTNSGRLDGDYSFLVASIVYDLGGGIDVIRNTGQMVGVISVKIGDDQIINDGQIAGDVLLAEGADLYDGRGGRHSGTVYGGDGNDRLLGGVFEDTLDGGAGNDIIDGGGGRDTAAFSGNRANYTITYSNGVTTVQGPEGTDTLTGIEQLRFADAFTDHTGMVIAGVINGSDERETLKGSSAADTLNGGGGDDILDGRGGADSISGGAGRDTAVFSGARSLYTISTANGVTTVTGASGTATLTGVERLSFADDFYGVDGLNYFNLVAGGAGDDTLNGNNERDRLVGGAGHDILFGGGGNDILDGGSGNDTAVFRGAGYSYTVTTENGVTTVTGPDGTDVLISIEFLQFDEGRFAIAGVQLDGGSGSDTLVGTQFRDLIYGNGGDDFLIGGAGNDLLDGGTGVDRAVYDDSMVRSLQVSSGGAWVSSPDGFDTLIGVEEVQFGSMIFSTNRETGRVIVGTNGADWENLEGNDYNDLFFGRDGRDSMYGYAGDDVMWGGRDGDYMRGAEDNDRLFGEHGDDDLYGDQGNDILIGGIGNDRIYGGNGYDIAGYNGVRRAYAASATSVSGNGEGVDSLTGVEDLAFTDGRLTFARDGQAAQVMRLYDAAFNRAPDQSGFEALLDTLENGSLTLQQLANEFINSTEFQSQYAGLTNQQFVEQLYQFCLNRAGDSGGIATWTAALNGGMSRGEVLLAFSESGEHKDLLQGQLDQGLWVADEQTLQIARLYDATYDRLPDQGGLATWRNALGGGMSLLAIAQAFATAPEFQARYGSLSNQAFVELMYQLCLNRNGDAGGIQTWTDALNGGMSRGEVLMFFSESAEHVALTRSTWLGGVPCTDVAAPAPVLPEDKHDDAGAQVIPMVADAGTDSSHDGKDGGAQVLPGADTAHDSKGAGSDADHDEGGAQVIPVIADGADTGGKDGNVTDGGPQVLPGAADDEAPVGGKDTAPLILPGVIDSVTGDGFLLAKTDGDTGPQILPGTADDGADFLFDMGGDAVDAGHDLPGLEHRLAMLFIETGEHAPGLDTGADSGPLDLHHNPDPWAA